MIWSEIGLAIMKGALSEFGSEIGAAVISELLQGGTSENVNWEQVREEIKEIVKEEIETSQLSMFQGTIDSVSKYISIDYKNKKDSGAPHSELYQLLNDPLNKIQETVSQLMTPEYRVPGLALFVIAAPLHITILQEMALMSENPFNYDDWEKHQNKCPEAEDIVKYATDYAKHILDETVLPAAVQRRLDQVPFKIHSYSFRVPPDTIGTSYYGEFTDTFPYPIKKGKQKDEQSFNTARDAWDHWEPTWSEYVRQVVRQSAWAGNSILTAGKMYQLEKNPCPSKDHAIALPFPFETNQRITLSEIYTPYYLSRVNDTAEDGSIIKFQKPAQTNNLENWFRFGVRSFFPDEQKIALSDSAGKYLARTGPGDSGPQQIVGRDPFDSSKTDAGVNGWNKFTVTLLGGDLIALQSNVSKYCSFTFADHGHVLYAPLDNDSIGYCSVFRYKIL